MIKKVRQGCFETNSSSAHSIIVTKNDRHAVVKDWHIGDDEATEDTEFIYVSRDGKLWLHDIEEGYGRYPFQFLTTFEEKLRYAMCEYLGIFYGDELEFENTYKMFVDIVKEIVPSFEDFRIETKDIDIYLDNDGNELLHNELTYDHWDEETENSVYTYSDEFGNTYIAQLDPANYLEVPNIGMVDHQSAGLLKNFLKENNVSLKEFLTNKKYIVVIDSDEECNWQKYKASGIIDVNNIIEEYKDSGEDLEYKEWLLTEDNNEEN